MTHDDLIKDLDLCIKGAEYGPYEWGFVALRAVVELHKPKEEVTGMGVTFEGVTTSLSTQLRCDCKAQYPCLTIQAIEKELK